MKRVSLGFIIALFLIGCGETLPEQDAKDEGLKPVFNDKLREAGETAKELSSSSNVDAPSKTQSDNVPDQKKKFPASSLAEKETVAADTVTSVVNYGTGYTHLSIKKKQEEKLKKIQSDYNKKLEKAQKE